MNTHTSFFFFFYFQMEGKQKCLIVICACSLIFNLCEEWVLVCYATVDVSAEDDESPGFIKSCQRRKMDEEHPAVEFKNIPVFAGLFLCFTWLNYLGIPFFIAGLFFITICPFSFVASVMFVGA